MTTSQTPAALTPQSFTPYPSQARALATRHLALLRTVPLPLLPILLREISTYDFKFPAERTRLTRQLTWLEAMPAPGRETLFAPFAQLALPPTLATVNWVSDAADYMEQLTAALWSTGEMAAFRQASQAYAQQMQQALPDPAPTRPRLVIAVLDSSLRDPAGNGARFTQLRQRGTLLTNIDPTTAFKAILNTREPHDHASEASVIVGSLPTPAQTLAQNTHWYIDGATPHPTPPQITAISYAALQPVRQQLLARARSVINSQRSGPQELRSMMSHLTPADVGLPPGTDPALTHFQLSLLAEGSGTQVFATTFVQWAARECLRRAEPETLVLNFQPRQRQQAMNGLLTGAGELGPDLPGSLIDSEQGAYYTWLNLLRLPGAEQARMLAWQQGSTTAVALGPGFAHGTTSPVNKPMQAVLDLLTL